MQFEGNSEVLKNLFRKKRMLEASDPRHEEIRPLLFIMSGTMMGVYGGGQVTALEEAGLHDVFDVAVGISTGAPTVAYFLSGQARLGTSIYYEECLDKNFLSFARMLGGGWAMDVEWLTHVFRGKVGSKALDQNAAHRNRTQFWVTVTNVETGELAFLNAKESTDALEAIKASLASPGVSHGNVIIENVRYCDGALHPMPIQEILSRFNPTDVLVLTNSAPQDVYTPSLFERLLTKFLLRKYPPHIQELSLTGRHAELQASVAYMRNQTQSRYALMWAGTEVSYYTQNEKKLRHAARVAEEHLTGLLNEARAGI